MTSRSFDQAQTQSQFRNLIDGAVIDFEWRELHTGPGQINETFKATLLSQLDWCRANGGTSGKSIKVRLRPRMGMYAPDWVKTNAGTLTWYTDKGTDGTGAAAPSNSAWKQISGGVPRWWVKAYLDAAEDFTSLIKTHFGNHPALCEVVMGWPTTQFAEPCLKQFGLQENLYAALDGGWTEALDTAAFVAGWNSHKTHFSPIGIATYTAYNPIGTVDMTARTFTFGNAAKTIELMNTQVSILGNMALVANNSLTAPLSTQNSHYQEMYNRMVALRQSGTKIAFQTETLGRHLNAYPTETVKKTIEQALAWGAQGVEIPIGCQNLSTATYEENYITSAYAKTVNPQFAANKT